MKLGRRIRSMTESTAGLVRSAVAASLAAPSIHYTDVTRTAGGFGRHWFRMVGPITVSAGSTGACTLLRFTHEGREFFFREKVGSLGPDALHPVVPPELRPFAQWAQDGSEKIFQISDNDSRDVFFQGAYAYFPSSRAEVPHWLNRGSLPPPEANLSQTISKELQKPIFVERGLDAIKQWLVALVTDIRSDFTMFNTAGGQPIALAVGNVAFANEQRILWNDLNAILRAVLCDPSARIVWNSRHSQSRIGFLSNAIPHALAFDALSGGQATLLTIFATLLKYGDVPSSQPVSANNVVGMCLIDEIDAHMHVDLQYAAIPRLIKLFPKVQFILSCHSPLAVLGLEGELGLDNVTVLELPAGNIVRSEAYSEFKVAMTAIQKTSEFERHVRDAANTPGPLLVFVEGETDPRYLITAARLLGLDQLLTLAEISWVGAKDARGQAFNTGKDALRATESTLRANPNLIRRPVLLLYDNDVPKVPESAGSIHVRSMPLADPNNGIVTAGIESFLPQDAFFAEAFDEKTTAKSNGTSTTIRSVNKTRLCERLCGERAVAQHFEGFRPVLEMILQFTAPVR